MSEMDVLFPLPDGRRNADDMGMPPEQARDDTNTNYEGRYQVVHASFWWRIKVGDGGVPYGRFYTKHEAEKMAALLLREFRNGIYVGQQNARRD